MRRLARFWLLLWPLAAPAAEQAASDRALAQVLETLNVTAAPSDLPPAPLPGFLEVVRGTQVLYVSADGRFLIDGDVLSLRSQMNLTERRRAAARLDLLAAVPVDERIAVPAAAPVRARIAIFVDTNCPYCRMLHERGAELARRGIEVEYLFFPRSGPSGASYSQAVAVWCAADRTAALGAVLGGAELPVAECEHPIERHYALARSLDLKGTPAVVFADGSIRYGVVDVDEILRRARSPGR